MTDDQDLSLKEFVLKEFILHYLFIYLPYR